MTRLQLAKVIADCKQVVDWLLTVVIHYKSSHVEVLYWEMDQCVLLRIVASKPFKVYYQNRRHIVHLNFFHRLLVRHTSIAVPSVLLREILWLVELSETILDAHVLRAVFNFVL